MSRCNYCHPGVKKMGFFNVMLEFYKTNNLPEKLKDLEQGKIDPEQAWKADVCANCFSGDLL